MALAKTPGVRVRGVSSLVYVHQLLRFANLTEGKNTHGNGRLAENELNL